MTKLISLISGLIFGLGLSISGMVNPEKVIGFLNIFREWDPSLIFVMVGAIITFSPLYLIFKRKSRPILTQFFIIPSKKDLDKNLIIGASLFGIGWGLVGLCPGPAISALSFFKYEVYAFVVCMFIGFYLGNILINRQN